MSCRSRFSGKTFANETIAMEQALRQWLVDGDEGAIDQAFFDNGCSHFFAVDWRENDVDIVQYCADCLGDDTIRGEWRDDSLVIIRNDNETTVPLMNDEGDRDITIRTLNEVLQPDYEIRFLVCSHGGDAAGFAVLAATDWQTLDGELSESVNENFIKLPLLPNIFTEMTEEHLPLPARNRFRRMLERDQRE